ncbi:nitroreductase/quinone reductase family protein [Amycolatopsis sp. cmx-4-61]|uniref:nitroreductase/quinone reductase family protein n=1 Tax=Amycolatopsis sp. cmx-4-61 TaxID=2790937 RepID=UPI00397A03BE
MKASTRRARRAVRGGGLPGRPAPEPGLVHNLRRQPHVELQDGPEKHDYSAPELTGSERDLWWERAVAAYPDYADTRPRPPV